MIEFVIYDNSDEFYKKIEKAILFLEKEFNVESNITRFCEHDDEFNRLIKIRKCPCIYILNVKMPYDSGMNLAKEIRKYDKNSIIIFATSNSDIATITMKERLNIFTIISRSKDNYDEVELALKEAITFLEPEKFIRFSDYKNSYSINLKNILYLTKDGRKTVIVTDIKTYSVNLALAVICPLLSDNFIKTHRACVVNRERVEHIDYTKRIINFDNGEKIDLLSDKYKKDINIVIK